MAIFRYTGRAVGGDAVAGRLESESAESVARHLTRTGIVPVSIEPFSGANVDFSKLKRSLGIGMPDTADLILFTRQLRTMVKSGLPFLSGLRSIAAATHQPVLKETLAEIVTDLESGRELAACFARHPQIFPEIYVSVVKVGETSGTLERSLGELVDYLQADKTMRDSISSALRYPMIVLVAIALSVGVIMMFVIPRFAPLFEILGDDIPLPTLIMFAVSKFASQHGFLLVATSAALAFAIRQFVRTPRGARLWDSAKLRIPVIGRLVHQGSVARIVRSLSMSLEAGLPMIEALGSIARTSGNAILTDKVLLIRDGVERGETIHRAIVNADLFPPLALQMIATGEQTGEMPKMLAEVADYYETETQMAMKNLSSLIEPLLVIVVGGIVLVLALAVFLPMWNMIAKMGAAA